jgi:hypothetical protein
MTNCSPSSKRSDYAARPRRNALDPARHHPDDNPPEDVGGPWGYGEMLEALADPKHERHAETLEWLGEDFDRHCHI